MKCKVVLAGLFILPILLAPAQAATPDEARNLVKSTVESVVAQLIAEKEVLEANPERIYDLIDEQVIPNFDFFSMSKWILGKKNWRGASDLQRETFVSVFKTFLVRTYGRILLGFSDEEFIYLETESNPKSTLVRVNSEVKSASTGTTTPIYYTLHLSDGRWKVVDVGFKGISLMSTYRGSWASEINKNGFDGLIAKLMEKNEHLAHSLKEPD